MAGALEFVKLGPASHIVSVLECPICRRVKPGPIYLCCNGHNVCVSCKPMLTECGMCRGKLSDLRNYALEELISKSTFKCPNSNHGCNFQATGEQRERLKEHLSKCEYGAQLTCTEMPCKILAIPAKFHLRAYVKHMKKTHGILELPALKTWRREVKYIFKLANEKAHCINLSSHNCFWNRNERIGPAKDIVNPHGRLQSYLIQYEGHVFILHRDEYNAVRYYWLQAVESDDHKLVVLKYHVSFSLKDKARKNQSWKTSWELPILPSSATFEDARKVLYFPKDSMNSYHYSGRADCNRLTPQEKHDHMDDCKKQLVWHVKLMFGRRRRQSLFFPEYHS